MPKKRSPATRKRILFEATNDFYDRLMNEKRRRDITVQEIATTAIENYLALSKETHAAVSAVAASRGIAPAQIICNAVSEYLMTKGRATSDESDRSTTPDFVASAVTSALFRGEATGYHPIPLAIIRDRLLEDADIRLAMELYDYVKQFPPKKIESLRRMLDVDLTYYRSARIKETE